MTRLTTGIVLEPMKVNLLMAERKSDILSQFSKAQPVNAITQQKYAYFFKRSKNSRDHFSLATASAKQPGWTSVSKSNGSVKAHHLVNETTGIVS